MKKTQTSVRHPWVTIAIALAAPCLMALPANTALASTLSTNLVTNFDVSHSFNEVLEADIAMDALLATQRLTNARLGDWQSAAITLTYTHSYAISILDPGVSTLPAAARNLLSIETQMDLSGALIGPVPVHSQINTTWSCVATALKCSTATVGKSRSDTVLPAAPPSLLALQGQLGPLHISGVATTEVLFPGTTLLPPDVAQAGMKDVLLQGSVRVDALYNAKTPLVYAGDAMAATTGLSPATRADRFATAAADIQALRTATYTSSQVVASQRVAFNEELQQGQALLLAAQDAAALVTPGATSFSGHDNGSGSLALKIWDVLAAGNPALGRSKGTARPDSQVGVDELAQWAALKAVTSSADDASFMAGLSGALAAPPMVSELPQTVLNGALFGVADAQVNLFYCGGDSSLCTFLLPAASRHDIWRNGSTDQLGFLMGPASGLMYNAAGYGDGVLDVGDATYIGEGIRGLLTVQGEQQAMRLTLNNYYSPSFLVVASYNVTAVPEPETWVMLLAGLALMGTFARRRL